MEPRLGVRYRKGLDLLSLCRVPRDGHLLPRVKPQSPEIQPQTWAEGGAQASVGCVNRPLFALGPQGRGQGCPSISHELEFAMQSTRLNFHRSF